MKIGLIDVDGHNFPNLALMRISAYHKAKGDDVEWWQSDLIHYDVVYMSKIFSDIYSPDISEPFNADKVIKGGTVQLSHDAVIEKLRIATFGSMPKKAAVLAVSTATSPSCLAAERTTLPSLSSLSV